MGPLFIKIGQLCSTRADLFDKEWIAAFSVLQNNMPLEPSAAFEMIVNTQFSDAQKNRLHVDWSHPIATASLAQVYPAYLDNTTAVVVKIIKPGIKKKIKQDFIILSLLIKLIDCIAPKRLHLKEAMRHMMQVILREVDLRYEALHSKKLYQSTEPWARCAQVYQDFVSPDIIVMTSFIDEITFDTLLHDDDRDKQLSQKIARDLLCLLTDTILRDGFFHADLHPGNMFIAKADKKLLLIDFGQVAQLSQEEHFYLCQQIFALLRRDFETMTTLFVEAGWIKNECFDKQGFERDLELLLQPLLETPLKNISIEIVIKEVIALARRYHINLHPGFLFAQKVVLMAEGLARQIDPSIVPLEVFEEHIFKAIKARYGIRAIPQHVTQQRWRLTQFLLGFSSKVSKTEEDSIPALIIYLSFGWAVFWIFIQYSFFSPIITFLLFFLWHMIVMRQKLFF
jgi:ubiquinone biosynthesis protein